MVRHQKALGLRYAWVGADGGYGKEPAETETHRLAQMQAQRFWIERSLQDGKSESGLADYQARKWSSWHHHMAKRHRKRQAAIDSQYRKIMLEQSVNG